MLNGWGGYLLTEADHANAFFSHDEYVDFFAGSGRRNLAEVRGGVEPGQSRAGG